MTTEAVITGESRFACVESDAAAFLRGLPDDSINLLFTSPPYEAARTYEIGFKRAGQDWVDWMVEIVKAAAPKVNGLIAINCEGQTRNYSYSGTPFLLFADLKRAGFNMRKPPVFQRVGIPGSGGPDWLRNDWEPIICVTRPGKMPWSENTACGHVPKYAPGGEMSNRRSDGERINKWGGHQPLSVGKNGVKYGKDEKLVPRSEARKTYLGRGTAHNGLIGSTKGGCASQPVLANPGNVIECVVGGGVMGHAIAHRNEAPFPLKLPTLFVKSFAPPGGIVCDPFSGSGTTAHAAIENGRRFIGCDIRQCQVDLTIRRIATVTRSMFAGKEAQ